MHTSRRSFLRAAGLGAATVACGRLTAAGRPTDAARIVGRLGERRVLLDHGQHGLTYFPDGRLAFVRTRPTWRVLMAAGVSSVLLEGKTMTSLQPVGTVLAPGRKGSFDNGYAGINAIYDAGDKGLLAFYHAEDHEGMPKAGQGIPGFYCSVGLAVSTDRGKSFRKLGVVLTSSVGKDLKGRADQGVGELSVLADPGGNYLHAYYTSHSRVNGRGVQVCMARCPVSKAADPRGWKKLHQGTFSQPGLGGRDTIVVTAKAQTADAFLPHVIWSPALRKYVMVYCINAYREIGVKPVRSGIYVTYSDDGIHWPHQPGQQLLTCHTIPLIGKPLAWQPTLLLDNNPDATGTTGWLYYAYSPRWGHRPPHKSHHLAARPITFSTE